MIGRIHSIETFGTVDGPGIRFVIFLQGCPLRCLYCHNPDTWEYQGGQQRTVEDILEEYEKYKAFLTDGGITVTGGEPLIQLDFVIELFEKAKEKGAHTCLDTSGITFQPQSVALMKKYDRLMEVTDLVILDIKHIDPTEHKTLTGQGQGAILEFARYISSKPNTDLWIRHVVVPGITDKKEYLEQIGEFLATLPKVNALDVLPYHTMGKVKYENLGLEYPLGEIPAMSKEGAIQAKNTIIRAYQRAKKTLA